MTAAAATAAKDYGVVVREVDADLAAYEVGVEATTAERAYIRANRIKWLEEDAEAVAGRYRNGELDMRDPIRAYGVIVNWGSGELLAETTKQFRAMLQRRTIPYWTSAARDDDAEGGLNRPPMPAARRITLPGSACRGRACSAAASPRRRSA